MPPAIVGAGIAGMSGSLMPAGGFAIPGEIPAVRAGICRMAESKPTRLIAVLNFRTRVVAVLIPSMPSDDAGRSCRAAPA